MYIQYINKKKPRVPKVPRVSRHTASFTGRYVPVPGTGTVYAGTGTVWENPTRGLPVLNPKWLHPVIPCKDHHEEARYCVMAVGRRDMA
jgi:hypothetical protein